MTDIEAIKGRIANAIYGDDRLTGAEVFDALAALDALVAEVERLRADNARIMLEAERHRRIADEAIDRIESAEEERADVLAWLREHGDQRRAVLADRIERGEHRREEKE